jgi:predicted RNase H-like HicB family nuclease
MRYAVVIERAESNYSAYVPDLRGCVATGPTVSAVEEEIRAAILFHIEGLPHAGLPIPEPSLLAAGEEVVIAKLVVIEQKEERRKLGTLVGRFRVPDDFDDSLPAEVVDAFEGR